MSAASLRAAGLGSAPLPLFAVAVGLLAAAGFLHGTGSTAGSPRLPLWLLFLGMGIIVLGGGIAVVLFGRDDASDEATAVAERQPGEEEHDAELAPEPDVSALRPVPEPPAPPRPTASWSTASPRGSAAATPGVAPAPARPSTEAPVATLPAAAPGAPVGGALSCATCGKPLPARAAWRRCRTCARSLCVACLTESVRNFGWGYCRDCAPSPTELAPGSRGT